MDYMPNIYSNVSEEQKKEVALKSLTFRGVSVTNSKSMVFSQ
jgi:hypothetical protein